MQTPSPSPPLPHTQHNSPPSRSSFPQGEFGPISLKSPSHRPASRRITRPSAGLSPAEPDWEVGSGAPRPTVPDIAVHGTEHPRAAVSTARLLLPAPPGCNGAQPWGTERPGPASIRPQAPRQLLESHAEHHQVPTAAPHQGTQQGQRDPRHGDPLMPPLPQPPLPACTVRRRRRKAVVAQPQRRVAAGRVPVSLLMASQAHLPARRAPRARLALM